MTKRGWILVVEHEVGIGREGGHALLAHASAATTAAAATLATTAAAAATLAHALILRRTG